MRTFGVLLSLFLLSSCQTAVSRQTASGQASDANEKTQFSLASKGVTGRLLAPGDWLGQELDFRPFDQLRTELEKQLGKPLKNRGEAHVTLISPPEMKILSQTLSPQTVTELATKMGVAQTSFEVLCLGRGAKESMATYFVVARSPRWLEFREEVARLAGKPKDFRAQEFYPHITLGFTDRDLHLQDGIIKNEKACLNTVTSL